VTAGIPVETEEERQRRIYEQVQGHHGAGEVMPMEGSQAGLAKAPRQTVAQSKSQQPRKAKLGGGKKLSRKQKERKAKASERGDNYSSMQEVVEIDKNKLQGKAKPKAVTEPGSSQQAALVGNGESSIVGNVVRTDKKKKRQNRKKKMY